MTSLVRWLFNSAKSLLKGWGWVKKDAKVIFVGLENSGKTTLLGYLKTGKLIAALPTSYAHMEEIKIEGLTVRGFDMGGHRAVRKLWREYACSAHGIVFLVDASDPDKFEESAAELAGLLALDHIKDVPMLILGTKIDVRGAASERHVAEVLNIQDLRSGPDRPADTVRPLELFMCSTVRQAGVHDAFRWLAKVV